MIEWFARNSVAANLLMLLILVTGALSLKSRMPLEVFPSFELDVVTINVIQPGTTPEDIEQGVSIRIEEAVGDLEGIDKLVSESRENAATVSVFVEPGYDPRSLLSDVKSRVDAISTFPSDIEQPVIELAIARREVITAVVYGEYSEREIRTYAEQVRDDLVGIDGLDQVELYGVRDYEIAIEVSQDRLREYGLDLADVGQAVASSSLDVSAGNVRTAGGDVLIRSRGQAYRRGDFERIAVMADPAGGIIYVGDLAVVHDGFEESHRLTRYNGQRAALIEVYRIGNQSAIQIAAKVRDYIQSQQQRLPAGLHLSYWDDNSQVVRNRLSTLLRNGWQGGLIIFLLLALFLRPVVAFWVFVGVPMSVLGAFIVLPMLGITLNLISLFGFILVLGILVDDAIVTGENIYRRMRMGETGLDASIRGTHEIAVPVTFGVLTTITAFAPMAFLQGDRAILFLQIPAVVIPVLLFSLIQSKLVLPAHMKTIRMTGSRPRNVLGRMQRAVSEGFEHTVLNGYQPVLDFCLRHRYSFLTLFAGLLLVILALLAGGWMDFKFFPSVPSETVRLTFTMPAGTPLEVTNRHVHHVTDAAVRLQRRHADPETGQSVITGILSTIEQESGRVHFELVPPEHRALDVGSTELLRQWRQLIGEIPGAESVTFRAEIAHRSNPIDVQMSATDLDLLRELADKVRTHLAGYPGLYGVADNLSDGKQSFNVELTAAGHALGLTRAAIARQVRDAFYGYEVQRIQRGRDDIRLKVRHPLDERRSVADLLNMYIRTPTAGRVPLSHVATLQPDTSPSTIRRIDRYRTVNVTADIDKTEVKMTILQQSLREFLDELLSPYPGVRYSLEGEFREQQESLQSLAYSIAMVLFIVYSLLAIPLKSYVQPLIVMSVIPFGAIGAIGGHWLMDMNLSMLSLLGLMALMGVVVNDSLVMVDFINRHVDKTGTQLHNAVRQAAAARFRPVMLTSLTTFFGLMPLLIERSTQAQFLIPMAISLGFGIIFATLITLVLVPINYLVLDDLKRLARAWLSMAVGAPRVTS